MLNYEKNKMSRQIYLAAARQRDEQLEHGMVNKPISEEPLKSKPPGLL